MARCDHDVGINPAICLRNWSFAEAFSVPIYSDNHKVISASIAPALTEHAREPSFDPSGDALILQVRPDGGKLPLLMDNIW